MRIALLFVALSMVVGSIPAHSQSAHLERVLPLSSAEGVFAYARISPDGRFLVYASQPRDTAKLSVLSQTIRVVDLQSRRAIYVERGIDPYWSPDGQRMIYESFENHQVTVNLRDRTTGRVTRGIISPGLGDYFSWGVRDGRDVILTILGHYFFVDSTKSILPANLVPPCDNIGAGERPLISKDGHRVSVFSHGTIQVRDLDDCTNIVDTGLSGAKADFSFDGRFIAFHAPKPKGVGYEIRVVDLRDRTVRTVTHLTGSSYFPSWTRDGRLCFRYDGDDYRGFMMASRVLDVRSEPLPSIPQHVAAIRSWLDIFPETPQPASHLTLVMVWGAWSAHSPSGLRQLEILRDYVDSRHISATILTALDPGTRPEDANLLERKYDIRLKRIDLAADRLDLTEAENQIPVLLLFRDGRLLDRRLGAQSFESMREWVAGANR
jgi:hypothetical protein